MLKGMPANKQFGGLHNLTITEETLENLEKALNNAQTKGQTKFIFQKMEVPTVYAQYILRYYGEEGKQKRNIRYR